jgi:hypothetical protein
MEDTHIWLIGADGTDRHELTVIDNRQSDPAWSSDGGGLRNEHSGRSERQRRSGRLYGVSAAMRRYHWIDRDRLGIEGTSYEASSTPG